LKDASLAEDATQEIFVRVLRHIDSAPDDRVALAWIYRISTNYCLNRLRDSRNDAEPVEELPEVEGAHPEASLMNRDLALRLVLRAPESLRAPAVLHYIDGMEQEKVAQMLGLSRRTVINRLAEFASRARKFIAREVGHG
jgi:RNA polymerase sigma-70 factor (ECF subfamily)